MKILLLLFCITSINVHAQDSTRLLSKFEKFTSATGKMYKYETIDLGKTKDIQVSISKVTDIESGTAVKALLLKQVKTGLFDFGLYGVLTIDLDEIEGVAKSLTFYQTVVKEKKPKNDPSYTYITNNDVIIGCSYLEGAFGGWSVILNQRYHFLKSTIPGSTIYLKNKDIDDLAEMINAAKVKAQDL